MEFESTFHHILQAIWEAYPSKGPVWVSNLDMIDVYPCVTLWPSQVGVFTYVTPSSAENDCIIICIYMVIPMGCVGSPKFFCELLETLTDVVNALVHTSLLVLVYGVITKISKIGPGPPHTLDILTHID